MIKHEKKTEAFQLAVGPNMAQKYSVARRQAQLPDQDRRRLHQGAVPTPTTRTATRTATLTAPWRRTGQPGQPVVTPFYIVLLLLSSQNVTATKTRRSEQTDQTGAYDFFQNHEKGSLAPKFLSFFQCLTFLHVDIDGESPLALIPSPYY